MIVLDSRGRRKLSLQVVPKAWLRALLIYKVMQAGLITRYRNQDLLFSVLQRRDDVAFTYSQLVAGRFTGTYLGQGLSCQFSCIQDLAINLHIYEELTSSR